MQIHLLKQQGLSIRKIAAVANLSRNAVRRALRATAPPTGARQRAKFVKLEPYAEQIRHWLLDPIRKEWTAARIHDEIMQRGYRGGATAVKAFVRTNRTPVPIIAEARFYVKPGQQMQVDWGEMKLVLADGTTRRLYVFVAVLAWSRQMFIRFTESMELLVWLDCHVKAFSYFGGVPEEVLIDNLKTGVESRAGNTVRWQDDYLQLAIRHNFRPIAHMPRRPKTKGRVERMVGFVRGRFALGREMVDIDVLNVDAIAWLDERANTRMHRTLQERPIDRFATERTALKSFVPFDVVLEETRVADAYALVSIDGVKYSVPSAHARATVTGQRRIDSVSIYYNGTLIATHMRPNHGILVVQCKEHLPPPVKTRHDKFSEIGAQIVGEFGEIGQRYINEVERRAPHAPLALLREVMAIHQQFDHAVILRSLETLLEFAVIKRGKLENLCYRYGGVPYHPKMHHTLPHIPVEQRPLASYDQVCA